MPASRLPIITQSAPAAIALVMSPENLMPPSAISGTPAALGRLGAFGDRGDLRNARAADHARGADRPRPDADLDSVHAQRDQIAARLRRCATLPAISSTSGSARFTVLTASITRELWPCAESIASTSTLFFTSSCARSRKSPDEPSAAPTRKPALRILGGVRILQLLLNVLDRDQALQDVLIVDHQQFFHAMAMQNRLGLFERGADGHGDEVFLGHHARNGQIEARLEAQVAIGQNAHQFAVLGHGHAGDAIALHHFERVGDLLVPGRR